MDDQTPANLNSVPRIYCFTLSLLHLFNCFLMIISPTHRSHRLSHHHSLFLSHDPITHRLSFVHAFYHLYHHLHEHLSQLKKITSAHQHLLFSWSHAMISTLTPPPPPAPPIPTFHVPFLCMSRSVPSPLLVHTSAFQHQNPPEMMRSLTCKVLFLSVPGSVH